MATLREKLAALLAAGIVVAGIASPRYASQLPDDFLDINQWEIEQKYELLMDSQAKEERKGKQEPDD